MRNIDLLEVNTTDTTRTNEFWYQRTGDLITLPYTEDHF